MKEIFLFNIVKREKEKENTDWAEICTGLA